MRRLRSRESVPLSDCDDSSSGGDRLDAGRETTDWEQGNDKNLFRSDSSSRIERKVQGLVGKLKSSMKGLGLTSRTSSVKAVDADDDVQARTAAMFGSQPSMSEVRQCNDWQQPSPVSSQAPDLGFDQRDSAAVQKGKVGFKMNRFSLPVFAAAVGAELRGYGVMGSDGAAGQPPEFEQATAKSSTQEKWSGAGGLDPWSTAGTPARPSMDPWSVTDQDRDLWSSTSQTRDDPWASIRSDDASSKDPWGVTSRSQSDLQESGKPARFSLQTGGGSTPYHVTSSGGGIVTRRVPSFDDLDSTDTGSATIDEWSATEETIASAPPDGSGSVRLGKLRLPSIRRMAEAAVDVLRGPTDGMEAQLPVGSRDPSAAPFVLEGSGQRQDMRTMLRERLQRGFRRSSSASAGLGTMAGSVEPWPASGSGAPSSTSSYGHLPSSTSGGYDDDTAARGYWSASSLAAVRAAP